MMSTTAQQPATTPIPVQLSEPEFTVFILLHLSMPKRGPKCKLGYHRVFNLILWVLYTGMQWKCLPVPTDPTGKPANFLPAHCGPHLNPIEGFWRVMKDAIGAGRCFPDLHQLYQRTRHVLMAHQERPIYAFHGFDHRVGHFWPLRIMGVVPKLPCHQ